MVKSFVKNTEVRNLEKIDLTIVSLRKISGRTTSCKSPGLDLVQEFRLTSRSLVV